MMFDEIMFLYSYSIGPANSSVGRASDCSSEGRRFKPGLADVNLVNSVGRVSASWTESRGFDSHTRYVPFLNEWIKQVIELL